MVVAAIREETDAAMNARATEDAGTTVYWLSLGELSRLIETFQSEGVTQAVMAGQVKTQADFFEHPAGLAAGETVAESAHAQYGHAAGRDRQSAER